MLEMAYVNSYVAYKELRENISLEYKRCVTKGLFTKSKAQPKRKGRLKSNNNEQVFYANKRRKGNLSVSDDIRLENRGCHWPTFVSNRGRREFCALRNNQLKPHSKCTTCNSVFTLRGKNRLRIFTLRLTGGAHRYHCSRRKQKPTFDVNKTLTGGAQRTSLNQPPGDPSRCFSTADSLWLGTRACAVLAISLCCQSMFRYFTARLEILTLKLGEWGATLVVLLVTRLKFQITRSLSVEFVTLARENVLWKIRLAVKKTYRWRNHQRGEGKRTEEGRKQRQHGGMSGIVITLNIPTSPSGAVGIDEDFIENAR
ncbi:DDE_Tnp_1_7 domain-containing protein [Trichonephila clavipes]|nr:DDE_Tnp_1_7 domain-containing protein [Trichonephila clavipes]